MFDLPLPPEATDLIDYEYDDTDDTDDFDYEEDEDDEPSH